MKISKLQITNFRAIKNIYLEDLSDTVIIAGPNGAGKSCIFDAIRLLKSAYGGYQKDEWKSWMGEMHIDVNDIAKDITSILNDKKSPLHIRATFCISESEMQFIKDNIQKIISVIEWEKVLPKKMGLLGGIEDVPPVALQQHGAAVKLRVDEFSGKIQSELVGGALEAFVEISPDGNIGVSPSNILTVLFSYFDPSNIGIIDYFGANRNYVREKVGGINLNIEQSGQRYRQSSLYNSQNKYSNIKSEMSSAYIVRLLRKEAGFSVSDSGADLIDTLKELFVKFFPGKNFDGPIPDAEGRLSFPVSGDDGAHYDINELSSGEKEILYGYLRIKNTSPRRSIILIDEPELHLNPRLTKGLPKFYHDHLGSSLENQLWLVTHSDAIIRDVIGERGFSVYHMRSPLGVSLSSNQAERLDPHSEFDSAVMALVSDLAGETIHKKLVLFESTEDASFDKKMVSCLFPELAESATLISATEKAKVKALHKILDSAHGGGAIPFMVYAIVDRDSDCQEIDGPNLFHWDRYHIENYLLEAEYIRLVLDSFSLGVSYSQEDVEARLLGAARDTKPLLLKHRLTFHVNRIVVSRIDWKFDPKGDVVSGLSGAISRTAESIASAANDELSEEKISCLYDRINSELDDDLDSGRWCESFNGREVLKNFLRNLDVKGGVPYEIFRNSLISKMQENKHRPVGMERLIEKVIKNN